VTDGPRKGGQQPLESAASPQGGAVGIVYAAGAWGLLQGLEYVKQFDWPRQVQQFATLGLLIGLPVVMVTGGITATRPTVSAAELTIITLLSSSVADLLAYARRATAPPRKDPLEHGRSASCTTVVSTRASPCCHSPTQRRGDQAGFADGLARGPERAGAHAGPDGERAHVVFRYKDSELAVRRSPGAGVATCWKAGAQHAAARARDRPVDPRQRWLPPWSQTSTATSRHDPGAGRLAQQIARAMQTSMTGALAGDAGVATLPWAYQAYIRRRCGLGKDVPADTLDGLPGLKGARAGSELSRRPRAGGPFLLTQLDTRGSSAG